MPSPGPNKDAPFYKESSYKCINDAFLFTYQATLWRREDYCLFFSGLLEIPEVAYQGKIPKNLTPDQQKKWVQVDFNVAENAMGQAKCVELLSKKLHLAYPRVHYRPNAVYLSPWPYRPTAVERGMLGQWVFEFAEREGFPIVV